MALVEARVRIAKPSKWVDSLSGSARAPRIKSLNMESVFEESMQIEASGWLVARWEGAHRHVLRSDWHLRVRPWRNLRLNVAELI